MKDLLKAPGNSGQSRLIGKLWASCCKDILQTAELTWNNADFEKDDAGNSMWDLFSGQAPGSGLQWWEGAFGFQSNAEVQRDSCE